MTNPALTIVHGGTAASFLRPDWLGTVSHRLEVLHRRMRRNRYLAITGRTERRYPWLETMMQAAFAR